MRLDHDIKNLFVWLLLHFSYSYIASRLLKNVSTKSIYLLLSARFSGWQMFASDNYGIFDNLEHLSISLCALTHTCTLG